MSVIIFGSTGMLGRYVSKVLADGSCNFVTKCITRKEYDIYKDSQFKLEDLLDSFFNSTRSAKEHYIINCAGIIPQKLLQCDISPNGISDSDKARLYMKVNALFPHMLANYVSKHNCLAGNSSRIKLIHITTDCVFDGCEGDYLEGSAHTETGLYGVSKSLGEPEDCCCIRTSIIGEELIQSSNASNAGSSSNGYSLLEWVRSHKPGSTINGFDNHYWNGVTCLTLAKVILKMILEGIYWTGVRHIYSPDNVNKYDLCCIINEVYDLNLQVRKASENSNIARIDKTLSTWFKEELLEFSIPEIKEQIEKQCGWLTNQLTN